jgi:amino acid transporter
MLGLALSTSFLGALTINTVIRIITYISTCAALLVLRRRPAAPPAAFRVPFGGALAVVAALTCLWLISSVTAKEAGMVAVAALIGLALFLLRPGALRRLRF